MAANKNERINYGKIKEVIEPPNLIDALAHGKETEVNGQLT
ncbi:MAG: hypothetical protein VCB81_02655 [Verrucomicrobiia bacterium]